MSITNRPAAKSAHTISTQNVQHEVTCAADRRAGRDRTPITRDPSPARRNLAAMTRTAFLWLLLLPSVAVAGDDAELAGSPLAVRGPTVGAVLTAAYAAAGLDRDPQGGWIRRARLAGLVPWVTVRTTRDTSWQDNQSEVGHGTSLELRATWRLDRLMFDGRELQVAAIEAARRRERRRLAARVIRTYFTWRRAANTAALDDRAATRAAEAEAELDALTDGWFSEQLRPPSHPARMAGSAKPAGAAPR
jgi:hypothetical protein